MCHRLPAEWSPSRSSRACQYLSRSGQYGVMGVHESFLPLSLPSDFLPPSLPQVQELLKNAQVIQFHRLCSLLGGRSRASALREEVQKCGVLVQGCWVVSSDVVYAGEAVRGLRNARDYIVSTHTHMYTHTCDGHTHILMHAHTQLWCFTQNRIILRKDIAAITMVTSNYTKLVCWFR